MRKTLLLITLISLLSSACHREQDFVFDNTPRETRAPGYVYIHDSHFMIDDSLWIPIMMNYKIDWYVSGDTIEATPVSYYELPRRTTGETTTYTEISDHFAMIKSSSESINTLRICIDVMSSDSNGHYYNHGTPAYIISDSTKVLHALEEVVHCAENSHLRVMFLLATPLDEELETFTAALLSHFANNPTVWAYDFMNEPLYFDTVRDRTKESAYLQVDRWRKLMNQYAPHQLFTIGFSEPTEVFSWDPSLMPVDFVEVHTYHPLRIASEMWWYGHYIGKPWMVGETALPSSNDSIPYQWQCSFLKEAYQCAIDNGAAGFGWWEFMDFPMGRNFEAQYTGIFSHNGNTTLGQSTMKGSAKPVTKVFAELSNQQPKKPHQPANYYNMLGYTNFGACGKVVDEKGHPIAGAVIKGWNKDWSIAQTTYSRNDGTFQLVSNDICYHFWISAPGMSTERLEKNYDIDVASYDTLPNRTLEYQQISYIPFLKSTNSMLTFKPQNWNKPQVCFSDIPGTVVLRKL